MRSGGAFTYDLGVFAWLGCLWGCKGSVLAGVFLVCAIGKTMRVGMGYRVRLTPSFSEMYYPIYMLSGVQLF